jgi:nucleoside-diphosphate-sugar epimerase
VGETAARARGSRISLSSVRTLIAGCGYVGIALGQRLVAEGHEVWGLRRDCSGLPESIRPIAADLGDASQLDALPPDVDYLVYAASAGESSEAAYRRAYVTGLRNLLDGLRGRRPRRVFFTSSTAVYGQADGSWVDEGSETSPLHFTGAVTLEAERLLQGSSLPATIVRCAGIYGPGRQRLIESVRQGTALMTHRFTNRIHRDDLAGAVAHLIRVNSAVDVVVASDDEPASQSEVISFLAERLGVPEPPAAAGVTDGAARGGHKRCRNARLKATGYQLIYPTYREGYAALLADG